LSPAGPVPIVYSDLFLLHIQKKKDIKFIKFFDINKRDTAKLDLNYDENQ